MNRKSSTKKVKAFNDLLSKILDVVCVFWSILWLVAGAVWVSQGQAIALVNVFLYGSPALVYLVYRYIHYYKDMLLQKKTKNNPV